MTPPTTAQVKDTIVAGLQTSLGQTIPIFPKAFVRVLAVSLAGVFILLWKYVGFLGLQTFISQASGLPTTINGKVVVPLVEWGRLLGVGDPNPSTQAQLQVAVTVKSMVGSLPANSQLVCSKTGVIYRSAADVFLNAPIVQVTIVAASDQDGGGGSGDIGNLSAGDTVSFANPLSNVATDATVVTQLVTGANAEDIEAYRARIYSRANGKPQGGAYADYREWGESVPGILHIYPYAGAPGQIDIYAEATIVSSGSADGIPTSGQQTAVFNAINMDVGGLATRRPVNAAINVHPITRVAFTVTVVGLTPSTATTQNAINAGVDEYLRSRAPFIVGLSTLPRDDRITRAAIAGIVDNVCDAAGASAVDVTIVPGPAYDLGNGEKAKLTLPINYL